MFFKTKKLTRGFTLIEITMVIAVFSGLMIIATNLLVDLIKNPQAQQAAMDNIDQARFVSSQFTNEIRSAAYGSYPLIKAEDLEIIFYSPVGASSGNINRIRYYLSGNNLYKGIIVPVNGIYNINSESIKSVLSNLSNEEAPLFYYYGGDYDGNGNNSPLSQPVNINQVKFVKINLIVQKQITEQSISTFSLNAGATIRVLKNNLSD